MQFNNSVLVQGRVVPHSALKLRSAGARVFKNSEVLYQGVVNRRDRPQIWQGKMILMRSKDSGPQSCGLSTALGKDLVKVEYGEIKRLSDMIK